MTVLLVELVVVMACFALVFERFTESAHFFTSLAGGQLGDPPSDFLIVEWTDSGESEYEWIAGPHVHHADDEAWYVLEGVLRFRALVQALHQPGAADYPAIFRDHDSELLS